MERKIIVLLYILLYTFGIKAQQFNIVHYSTSEGLSNSCVYGLYQDKKGFLWVATEFGLNKFDGNTFTSYDVSSGFPENITISVVNGIDDGILVGTFSKGIVQLFPDGQVREIMDPFKGAQISKMYYVDSTLYVYSKTNVLMYSYRTKQKKYFSNSVNPDSLITAVSLWNNKLIASTEKSMFLISPNEIKPLKTNRTFNEINALHIDKNGNLWVGTKGVIYKLNTGNFSVTDSIVFDNTRQNLVDCIMIDHKDRVWFSTMLPAELFVTVAKQGHWGIENISRFLGIGNTDVNSLLQDRENNVWISTYNKGLYCVRNTFLYTNSFFKNTYINSIFVDNKSNIYIGSLGGIHIVDPNGRIISDVSASKNQREYTYGFMQHKNTIFVQTNGAYPENFSDIKNNTELKMQAARAILFFNDSTAVLGRWNNVVAIKKYKNKRWVEVCEIALGKEGSINNRVSDLVMDKDGEVWCGADHGLYKINLKTESSKKIDNPYVSGKINDVLIDHNNTVWFATENSIVKYDRETWSNYSELSKHKLGKVNTLAIDKKNRLYVGTLKGLFIIENGISSYLDDKSGLSTNEINELAYDSAGNNMLIATNESYAELNINEYENFKKLPISVNITSVMLNDSVLPFTNNYKLNYNQKSFRINFVAINLTYPRSVIYQYQVDGGTWVGTLNHTLEFGSLSYGDHTIRIRASLDNRNWCKPSIVTLNIKTPYFATFIFWITIIGLLGILIFYLVQLRIKRIRLKAAEKISVQKQIEELKFRSLNASINPHFIFNSLNSIQNYINHNDKSKASNYLGKFARLIRLVLDKANEKEISVKEELERLKYYIQLEQDRFNHNFTYEIIAKYDLYHVFVPNMIVQPLVENAILHGVKEMTDGHIEIRFFILKDQFFIEVEDNGAGIYNSNNSHTPEHKSMALNNIKERLETYAGASLVMVQRGIPGAPLNGTLVTISIPLATLSYNS
ncbi:MAG: two-component regulator propeller domain-containing protein [Bacteroidota bacterium]